jgi:hypothetical protein
LFTSPFSIFQQFGIFLRLLHPFARRFVSGLCFDHRNHDAGVTEQILRAFLRTALLGWKNPTVGKSLLFRDGMRIVFPTGDLQFGQNKFAAGVRFVESEIGWLMFRSSARSSLNPMPKRCWCR